MSRLRAAAIAMLLALEARDELEAEGVVDPQKCPICGHTAKREGGECDFCGTHKCTDCGELHLGPMPHFGCKKTPRTS